MYHCTEKSIVVLATFQLDINSNPGKIYLPSGGFKVGGARVKTIKEGPLMT